MKFWVKVRSQLGNGTSGQGASSEKSLKERRNNYAQGRIDFRRVVSEGGDNSAKLPLVDVHDSVMQAIGLGNGHLAVKPVPHQQEGDIPDIMHRVEPETYAKRYRKRMWSRPVRRWAAVLILVVLVGGSYSLFKESPWQAAKFQYEVLPYEPLLATKEGGRLKYLRIR